MQLQWCFWFGSIENGESSRSWSRHPSVDRCRRMSNENSMYYLSLIHYYHSSCTMCSRHHCNTNTTISHCCARVRHDRTRRRQLLSLYKNRMSPRRVLHVAVNTCRVMIDVLVENSRDVVVSTKTMWACTDPPESWILPSRCRICTHVMNISHSQTGATFLRLKKNNPTFQYYRYAKTTWNCTVGRTNRNLHAITGTSS